MDNLEVYECSAYWTKKTSRKEKRQVSGGLLDFLNNNLLVKVNEVASGKRLCIIKY